VEVAATVVEKAVDGGDETAVVVTIVACPDWRAMTPTAPATSPTTPAASEDHHRLKVHSRQER
jgi:hypothetical protein